MLFRSLAEEHFDVTQDLILFDPDATWKKTKLAGGTYNMKELLIPVFQSGQCVYETPDVMEIQNYCKEQLNTLWEETRRLVNPQAVYVDLSDRLYEMKTALLNQAL